MKDTEQNRNKARERLKKSIRTKITTTMVHPLAVVETALGHLWMQGTPEEKLSDEQLMYRKKWNLCREQILNNGNAQARHAMLDLDNVDILQREFKAEFIPVFSEEDIEVIYERRNKGD